MLCLYMLCFFSRCFTKKLVDVLKIMLFKISFCVQREYEVSPDEMRLGKAEELFERYLQSDVRLIFQFII